MTTPDDPFPAGVPPRRRRPRSAVDVGTLAAALGLGTVAAAAVGGLFLPVGVVAAAAAALARSLKGRQGPPLPLELALRTVVNSRQLELAEMYRHGPRRVTLLVNKDDSFWTVDSEAPAAAYDSPEDIDDWLYGDVVDFQLPAIGFGERHEPLA